MKGGTQAALALGVGYLLGRRHKMRMATMLAAAAATGRVGGLGGAALRRGAKMLGSTETLGKFAPQLGELAETVRGDLVDAGKAAATAAITNRIESLTDSLHERAEMVRDPGSTVTGAGKAAGSGAGKAARSGAGKARSAASGVARRARRGQEMPADEEADEPSGEDERYAEDFDEPEGYEPGPDEEEADEPEAEADEPEADEEEADEEEADEEEAAPVRRRTTRRRSPVARAGR
jgi:hypothetical protein